jgi:uncharacterized protein YjiS (DUF1127 family)
VARGPFLARILSKFPLDMQESHGCRVNRALFISPPWRIVRLNRSGRRQRRAAAQYEAQERGMKMNLARSFNNWRKYRQTVNELGRMSDRELRDLGIGRSDIPYIARKASI